MYHSLRLEREVEFSQYGRSVGRGWSFTVETKGTADEATLAANELRKIADELDRLADNPLLGLTRPVFDDPKDCKECGGKGSILCGHR